MTRDFLDELDAAVDGRCSCGCAAVITAASPSAWFASETCAARWHRGPDRWDELRLRLIEKWRAFVAEIGRLLQNALAELIAAAKRIVEAFVPLDMALPPPALPRPRPPARIDPGGGISAVPRGRPVFRPARTY